MTVAGKRVLAIGASSGAGAGIARVLAADGARVAFAARRLEKVEALAARAGGGAIGLQCDVCVESSCFEVVERAVEELGGLDAVLYAPAIIAMSTLMEADAAYWEEVFRTNVVGAASITRAAVPHLGATRGRVMYLSSVSSSGAVWPGLGVYMSTKAALERMVEVWRAEHPEVLFTCLTIGPIDSERAPDDIPASAGSERAMKVVTDMMPIWAERGLVRPQLPDRQIAAQVEAILGSDADVERLVIQAPW